jgi:Arc/MetJ-type ribon-helix-helix transcriptional regulator
MTLNIQLPDELSRYVQEQVAKRGYKDASEYLAAVLEAEQHRQLDEEVDRLLLEAVDGPFAEWKEQELEDVRQAGSRIIQRRQAR